MVNFEGKVDYIAWKIKRLHIKRRQNGVWVYRIGCSVIAYDGDDGKGITLYSYR